MALTRRNINTALTHTPETSVKDVVQALSTPINQPLVNNSFTASVASSEGKYLPTVPQGSYLKAENVYKPGSLSQTYSDQVYWTLQSIFENSNEWSIPTTGPIDTKPLSSATLKKTLGSYGFGYIDARPLTGALGAPNRLSNDQAYQARDLQYPSDQVVILDFSIKGGLGANSNYYKRPPTTGGAVKKAFNGTGYVRYSSF